MKKEQRFAFLCVGGPRGGERFESPNSGFVVPVGKMVSVVGGYDTVAEESFTYENVRYVVECFRTREEEIGFWRPENQPLAETVKLLLDVYEKNAHTKWC